MEVVQNNSTTNDELLVEYKEAIENYLKNNEVDLEDEFDRFILLWATSHNGMEITTAKGYEVYDIQGDDVRPIRDIDEIIDEWENEFRDDDYPSTNPYIYIIYNATDNTVYYYNDDPDSTYHDEEEDEYDEED